MNIREAGLPGAFVIEPDQHPDERGWFTRWFDADVFAAHGLISGFDQNSVAYNRRAGTLRGLHFQAPPDDEYKLVCCVAGRIFDVLLDLRPGEHYGRTISIELTAATFGCLYVPPGCAHGYQTLVDDTSVMYCIRGRYVPTAARGFSATDQGLGIRWPLPISARSARDAAWAPFPAASTRSSSGDRVALMKGS